MAITIVMHMAIAARAIRDWPFSSIRALLRRLPFFLLLKRLVPQLKDTRDALFAGWFGPIGVAALFYAMLALRCTGHEVVWSGGSLLICASLVAHAMTAAPLARLYGRSNRPGQPEKTCETVESNLRVA